MMKLCVILSLLASGNSFVLPGGEKVNDGSSTSLFSKKNDGGAQLLTRRDLGAVAALVFGGLNAAVALPLPANADVTNKVASTAAVRAVKRALRDLEKAELPAVSKKYADVKEALRTPGLNEVRKNCLVLIRGGEDGPDAESLKTSYSEFVKAIEALDGQASLGMRGRKNVELVKYYDESVKSLRSFLEVGERSAAIPLAVPSEEATS